MRVLNRLRAYLPKYLELIRYAIGNMNSLFLLIAGGGGGGGGLTNYRLKLFVFNASYFCFYNSIFFLTISQVFNLIEPVWLGSYLEMIC